MLKFPLFSSKIFGSIFLWSQKEGLYTFFSFSHVSFDESSPAAAAAAISSIIQLTRCGYSVTLLFLLSMRSMI